MDNKKTEERFMGNGDGTITDNHTNLMWQKEDDGEKRKLRESEAYCKTLTLGGHRDWRLPTINELNLVGCYWKKIFPNPKDDDPYWSSTVLKNPYSKASEDQKYAAKVMFSSGEVNQYFIIYCYYTRAVRNLSSKKTQLSKSESKYTVPVGLELSSTSKTTSPTKKWWKFWR